MFERYDRDEVSGAKGLNKGFNIGCLVLIACFMIWVILYGIIL